jgi:hypothetical protein
MNFADRPPVIVQDCPPIFLTVMGKGGRQFSRKETHFLIYPFKKRAYALKLSDIPAFPGVSSKEI